MKESPRARLCKKKYRGERGEREIQRSAAHFIKMNRRGRLCKKNIAENEAIQRSATRFIKTSRRGRLCKKYRGERGEREIQRSAAHFIKMNRRGRLCKKNIAENAENEAIQRSAAAFY